jgi:hypothetical protein
VAHLLIANLDCKACYYAFVHCAGAHHVNCQTDKMRPLGDYAIGFERGNMRATWHDFWRIISLVGPLCNTLACAHGRVREVEAPSRSNYALENAFNPGSPRLGDTAPGVNRAFSLVCGEYFLGDGLGSHTVLDVRPDGSFSIEWKGGCLSPAEYYRGRWQLDGSTLVLAPAATGHHIRRPPSTELWLSEVNGAVVLTVSAVPLTRNKHWTEEILPPGSRLEPLRTNDELQRRGFAPRQGIETG